MQENKTSKLDIGAIEADVLAFWRNDATFEKSLAQSTDEHVFYDGPPFPTNTPHHGTIFVSILKDALARYFTMAGYSIPRVWGWDCHGLPIENAVERQLGIENKAEIEKSLGVAAFNEHCRDLVSHCNDAWKEYIDRIGRWVDYANAYRSMDLSYMESVLWVFKQCHDRGLIYKNYRVTPYCYRCETSLSISDTRESDSTRPRQDPAVTIRFKAAADIDGRPTYYLAWTTTPWTLTANLALAVGPEMDYVAFVHEDAVYIMAEALLGKFSAEFGDQPEIIERFRGADLVGRVYEPILPFYADLAGQGGYYTIIGADFVSLDDGVGIVHMAPAFGEEDYWTCREHDIEVKNPVDAQGRFMAPVDDYAGRVVLECNKDIIRRLKEDGSLIKHATTEHNYPHCWRCREPLIYRAMEAWYFAVEKIKPALLEHNEDIRWVPAHVKDGRFGKWLAGARDWNISRSRFWGTPIPVWECQAADCDAAAVFGSVAELSAHCDSELTDLHKEHLDEIEIPCADCGGVMRRVPEVLDCWFESGSMPFGQCHYPFENKEWFESHFPADFIVEYPGQIRGWFYYLHVLAVALFDRPAFKNCLVHGTLLAADGAKLSKSKKNFTDPMELVDTYGADALRIYLLNSPAAAMDDMLFKDSGVAEQVKNVLLPLWNAYQFFVTYAEIDGYKGSPDARPASENALDRWILARLRHTEREVKEAFEGYQLNRSLAPVLEFIDDLTNWYVRQSRERFWSTGESTDKQAAYDTLYYVLVTLTRLLAPSAPFVTEKIFQGLGAGHSVHLGQWPEVPDSYADEELIAQIDLARAVTSLGLALRQKAGLKTRQPLPGIAVALPSGVSPDTLRAQVPVIMAELRVKTVEIIDDPESLATVRATANPRYLGPKFGKETQDIIRAAKAGQVRQENGHVVVYDDDREWSLDPDEISIGYEGRVGAEVMSDRGILVSLDTTVTPELREEGVANDLNRCIQDLRKEASYDVSDRILLHLDGPLDDKWKENLFKLALADSMPAEVTNVDKELQTVIDDRSFVIRIKRSGGPLP